MSDASRGALLGRYRLREQIGCGGSSVVYRAAACGPGRPPAGSVVAIKVADPLRGPDAASADAFARQAGISAAVDHPQVLPVLDLGAAGGRPFLVTPLVDGIDLARRLAVDELAPPRALRIVRDVAAGLDAAHEHGVLHLDVKPSNVLLGRLHRTPGSSITVDVPDAVVLADFGSGCRLDGDPEPPENFVGSPRYAAPERLRGDPPGPAADVYSLACLLFACLAGRPPYIGDVSSVVTGHFGGVAPSLAAVAGLPAAIDDVISTGLAPHPGDRFPCCADLADAAGAVLAA